MSLCALDWIVVTMTTLTDCVRRLYIPMVGGYWKEPEHTEGGLRAPRIAIIRMMWSWTNQFDGLPGSLYPFVFFVWLLKQQRRSVCSGKSGNFILPFKPFQISVFGGKFRGRLSLGFTYMRCERQLRSPPPAPLWCALAVNVCKET